MSAAALTVICGVAYVIVAVAAPTTVEQTATELPRILGCDWGTVNITADKVNLITLQQAGLVSVILGVNVGWSGAQRSLLGRRIKGLPVSKTCFWDGKDNYNP